MMYLSKTKMVHVPFKGSGLALIALTAGEIDVLIMAIPAAAGQVKAGRARALMVFSTERSPALPDVPSARDLKMEDYIVRLWYGVLAPSSTPANLISRQNAEIVKAMNSPDLRKRLLEAGIEPLTSTPDEFAKFIATESVLYAKIVKSAAIPPQ
jgi:tripartite-type tricarboxylate transporter receptor subunit TctC